MSLIRASASHSTTKSWKNCAIFSIPLLSMFAFWSPRRSDVHRVRSTLAFA